jgi:putative aldouronate transport system substrate-binding protein
MLRRSFVVAILLLSVLSFDLWAGGGRQSGASGQTAGPDRSNFNALGTFPLVKTPATITVLTASQFPEFNPDTNWLINFYKEKSGVNVEWRVVPQLQFKERVNLALASGEVIDVVLVTVSTTVAYSPTEISKLASQKIILPLNNYIENDTLHLKQRMAERDGWKDVLTLPDGNIYVIPTLQESLSTQVYGKLWVNREFMKNVGITTYPTTLEEFRQLLIAFRDKDANGNGDPSDEIPFMGSVYNYTTKVDPYIMCAFVYDDGENRLFLRNGRVTAAYQQPEFREGLRYIRQLYQEGLIYSDSFVVPRATRDQINSQKYESVIGVMPQSYGAHGTREPGQPVRWTEYEPIAPLKGPNGLQITRFDYFQPYRTAWPMGFLPETCRDPALIMRWLDWFYSEEGTLTGRGGQKGVSWTDADPGATGTDGRPATRKGLPMEPGHPQYQNHIYLGFPFYEDNAYGASWQQPDNPLAPDGSGGGLFLDIKSRDNYAPYAIPYKDYLPPLYYPEDVVTDYAILMTNINTYVEECIAKFVVGQMNLDTEWDLFQSELKKLGIDRYLQITQNAYNSSAFAQ